MVGTYVLKYHPTQTENKNLRTEMKIQFYFYDLPLRRNNTVNVYPASFQTTFNKCLPGGGKRNAVIARLDRAVNGAMNFASA